MVERFRGVMDWFNRELKQIDPNLELVFAPPTAKTVGLKPGRWHVLKHVPGGPPNLKVIEGPDGEYVDPDSGLFDMLARSDLWNDRAVADQRRRAEAAQRAKERQEEREREALRAEAVERWAAVSRAQVSMNRSVPWSQNHAGRRGARRR